MLAQKNNRQMHRNELRLGIRVDANESIATGHLMRCLAIADQLKEKGVVLFFFTSDHFPEEILKKREYESICLSSEWNQKEAEVEEFVRKIREFRLDAVLIDSYSITPEYIMSIKQETEVIYLDDLGLDACGADALINYNIYARQEDYQQHFARKDLILGTEYVPLRKEFQQIQPVFRQQAKQVFISTGGGDPYQIGYKLLWQMMQEETEIWKNLQFHVIAGSMNKNLEALFSIAACHKQIHIHHNVKNMSEIMQMCDVAVTAGGSTMYELCAWGVPMVTYSFADNQMPGVQEFLRRDLAPYAGDIRMEKDEFFPRMIQQLKELIQDSKRRETIHNRQIELVDGKGADRLAERIIARMKERKQQI